MIMIIRYPISGWDSIIFLMIGKVIIILMRKKVEINKNRLFFLIFCDYSYPYFESNKSNEKYNERKSYS